MPTPVGIERAVDSIRKRWPDMDVMETELDPETLARRMDHRRRSDNWRDFYWIDVVQTAQGFFDKEELYASREFAELRSFLLHQVYPDGNVVYNNKIFNKYLQTFARRSSLTKDLASSLDNIESWSEIEPSVDRLRELFQIFDVDVVTQRVADFMDEADHPYIALREIGVEAPHGAGLMQEACKIFVDRLADRISRDRDRRSIDKLLDWIHSPDIHNGASGFIAERTVDALLLPWHQREMDDPDLRDVIKKRLVEAFRPDDPRTATSGVWVHCSPKARKVIMRWLAKDAIDVFFEIISETANERSEHARMWKNRRNIWFDLYNENRITEAWFALSDEAESIAVEMKREKDMDTMQFAKNVSGAADRYKCLLIMKIDDRWVVEGSYSFKTHIFPAGTSIGGFKESYTCDEFRYFEGSNQPRRITHHASWEHDVLRALEQ